MIKVKYNTLTMSTQYGTFWPLIIPSNVSGSTLHYYPDHTAFSQFLQCLSHQTAPCLTVFSLATGCLNSVPSPSKFSSLIHYTSSNFL